MYLPRDAVVGSQVNAAYVPHVGQVQLVESPLVCVCHITVLEHVTHVLDGRQKQAAHQVELAVDGFRVHRMVFPFLSSVADYLAAISKILD